MANFRTALLTIRAWVERGSRAPLRASIRTSNDVAQGFDSTVTVTSPEAGAEAVKVFLEDVLDADRRDEGPSGGAVPR